jgi:hypothetical protein
MKKILLGIKKFVEEIANESKEYNDLIIEQENKRYDDFKTIDQQLEDYFKWYQDNILDYQCRDEEKNEELKKLKKLISKFVAWYEIRYPDYELSCMVPFPYSDDSFPMNEILKEEKQVSDEFDWATFYDKKVFLKSLSIEEKMLISNKYIFNGVRWLHFKSQNDLLHGIQVKLSKKMNVSYLFNITLNSIEHLSNIKGKNIEEAIQILKEHGYELEKNDRSFLEYYNSTKENSCKILEAVMYSLMKSGGRYAGPRRALLFAQEFHLNMDIPMSYGVISDDENTLYLIDEYLKNGGHEDLICCVDYFRKDKKVMPLNDIIEKFLNDEPSYEVQREISSRKYDLEEQLVTILNSQIDPKELENEKIRKYRIERKLKGN